MTLNNDQQRVADAILSNLDHSEKAFLITAAAGYGKSFLINHLMSHLRSRVLLCAPTGIAALNIGGQTLHSTFGLSPHIETIKDYTTRYPRGRPKIKKELQNTSHIIIDEISMVHASFFDLIDQICRLECSEPALPFGGLCVILVGDFAQLGPVSKSLASPYYAFESRAWAELKPQIYHLTIPQRHPDPAFASCLRKLRIGSIDDEVVDMLKDLSDASAPGKYVTDESVMLESLNAVKDAYNAAKHLENKASIARIYHALKNGVDIKSCLAPDELSLKIGSPVIHLINNSEDGIYNGTTGKIVDFSSDEGHPIMEIYNADLKRKTRHTIHRHTWKAEVRSVKGNKVIMETMGTKIQYPLTLAYVISGHKSQGMTLDPIYARLDNVFAKSHAYVMLSRAKCAKGLRISGINSFDKDHLRKLFRPDQRVLDFYSQ